jgi:hypothetical protein
MILTGTLTRDGFEQAIANADAAGISTDLEGLSSPGDGELRGLTQEIWESIRLGLRKAFLLLLGRDKAREAMDLAIAKAQAAIESAGTRARELQAQLLEKIQAYLTTVVDAALQQVRPELVLGGQTMPLTSVSVAQRITLGGEIGLTLEGLFSLTSDGEIEVAAQYGLPQG